MNGKMHKVEICSITNIQLRRLRTEMTRVDMRMRISCGIEGSIDTKTISPMFTTRRTIARTFQFFSDLP